MGLEVSPSECELYLVNPQSEDCTNHCGLKLKKVRQRVTPEMNGEHENMTKSVWESRFIQILVVPFWLKNTAEKMTSLQMCLIKKIALRTGQTF